MATISTTGTVTAPTPRIRQEDGTVQIGTGGTPFSTTTDLDTAATSIHAGQGIGSEFSITNIQTGANGWDEVNQFVGIMASLWLCPGRAAATRIATILSSYLAQGGPG